MASLPKLPKTVRGKDYIETRDWTDKEIELLLKTSADLKKAFKAGRPTRYLPDKTAFLFFFGLRLSNLLCNSPVTATCSTTTVSKRLYCLLFLLT